MDTFAKEYLPLSDEQKEEMLNIKAKAEELEALYQQALISGGDPRLVATAKTYLEISVMLAVKAITRPIANLRPKDQA